MLDFGANFYIKDRDERNAYELAKGYHIPAQNLFEMLIRVDNNI